MIKVGIIDPDPATRVQLEGLLGNIPEVVTPRAFAHIPTEAELIRYVRVQAPQILFITMESLDRALELLTQAGSSLPDLQFVAVCPRQEPEVLLHLMRLGIRETLFLPLSLERVNQALSRLKVHLPESPVLSSTDRVYSFLPAKPGVGTSTVAVNASLAVARISKTPTLLSDFDLNSGMVRFLLKLDIGYGLRDAVEAARQMDENMWDQIVSRSGPLSVLHAGSVNPGVRIDPAEIQTLVEFWSRIYQVILFDLSGNLEQYSIELMRESKHIFLVTTAELPALHLAKEKASFLKSIDLGDRIQVILNRWSRKPLISQSEIEKLLGAPVHFVFDNDYPDVHRAVQAGTGVGPTSALGQQFASFAQRLTATGALPQTKPAKKGLFNLFSPQGRSAAQARVPEPSQDPVP